MNFWLPYTLIDEIRLHARMNELSFSAALRDLIERGLNAPALRRKIPLEVEKNSCEVESLRAE